MSGGTPEVRSHKSLTILTLDILHSTNGPMEQWTTGPLDQWTNGTMAQLMTLMTLKISPRYPKDIPKISQRYPKDIPKIFQRYPKDIP